MGYPVHASFPPRVVNSYIRCVRGCGTRVLQLSGAMMGLAGLSTVSLLITCVATNSEYHASYYTGYCCGRSR
jgi:hypothetical protein